MTLQSFNIIIGDRCLEAYPYDYYCLSCIYALCQNIITSMVRGVWCHAVFDVTWRLVSHRIGCHAVVGCRAMLGVTVADVEAW